MKGDVLKQARVLNEAELKRVLAVAAQGKHAARNRMAIMLSHYAGLRVGEIASLTWGDLLGSSTDTQRQFWLAAENTKSKEARVVHVSARLMKELETYRRSIELVDPRAPLIRSQKGGAFTANSLCQLFSRIYAASGLVDATSHSGRRWFITRLAHAGISPKVIMVLAGHKTLATTQRYIDVNDELLAQAVEFL